MTSRNFMGKSFIGQSIYYMTFKFKLKIHKKNIIYEYQLINTSGLFFNYYHTYHVIIRLYVIYFYTSFTIFFLEVIVC